MWHSVCQTMDSILDNLKYTPIAYPILQSKRRLIMLMYFNVLFPHKGDPKTMVIVSSLKTYPSVFRFSNQNLDCMF